MGRWCHDLLTLVAVVSMATVARGQCETGKVVPSDGLVSDQFGAAVDLSGGWLIAGAPGRDFGVGAAYVYERMGTSWVERALLVPSNPVGFDDFGRSVAITGLYAAVGMPKGDVGPNSDIGLVQVYRRSGTAWILEGFDNQPGVAAFSEFGTSVSLFGDGLLAGAPNSDGVNTTGLGNSGSAYVYRRNASFNRWDHEVALTASDAGELDTFGAAVKLQGNWAFVGAPADKDPNISASNTVGAVYVFLKQGANWFQVQKLTASDTAAQTANRRFGATLDCDGNVLIVGERQGQSAYVFRRVGITWAEEAILKKPAAHTAGNDQFATAVAIEGDLALVGAPLDDDNALSNSGTVFAYRRIGGAWTAQPLIHATDAAVNNRLGVAMAIDGTEAAAGALQPGVGTGAVYVLADSVASDCDGSGIEDTCEIRLNPSLDGNNNGRHDACDCMTSTDCNDNMDCTIDSCNLQTGNCEYGAGTGICLIGGLCFSSGTLNPANGCEHCDPIQINEGWSSRPDNVDCGDGTTECMGAICLGGACVSVPSPGVCVISGFCYQDGGLNPTDPCQYCNTLNSQTEWTTFVNGTVCHTSSGACSSSGYCNQGVCSAAPIPGEWQSINPIPGVSGTVLCSTGWDPDGPGPHPELLVVGGSFTIPGVPGTNNIAAWDRTRWIPLGQGFDGAVFALAVGKDQHGHVIYAGGSFTASGATALQRIAKWNRLSWSAVGSGFSDNVYALYAGEDQSGPFVYAGGKFTLGSPQFAAVAKWDGAEWTALGQGMSTCPTSLCGANIQSLIMYDSGTGHDLYASGFFNYADGVNTNRIARWRNGHWEPVGTGFFASGAPLVVFDDGGGKKLCTSAFSTSSYSDIGSWDGQAWSLLPRVFFASVTTLCADNDPTAPALYVGGPNKTLRKWDGLTWSYLNTPTFNQWKATSLTVMGDEADKRLFMAGDFYYMGEPWVRTYGIASWDGQNWRALSSGVGLWAASSMANVSGPTGEVLYFNTATERSEGIEAVGVIRWDGQSWSSTGTSNGPFARKLVNIASGQFSGLYALDVFSFSFPNYGVHIERFDGTYWSQLGGNLIDSDGTDPNGANLRDVVVFDDGNGEALYACGWFNSAGGVPTRNIARWNGQSWAAVGSGVGIDAFDSCEALEVFDDGSGPHLYAAGTFHFTAGSPPHYLVRWNGVGWQGISVGILCNAHSLKSFDDGSGPKLFVGGSDFFGAADDCERVLAWDGANWSIPGGSLNAQQVDSFSILELGQSDRLFMTATVVSNSSVTICRLYMWNGQAWIQVAPDVNGAIGALEMFDDGSGSAIIARGNFNQLGEVSSFGLARWACPFPRGDVLLDRVVNFLDFQALYPCLDGPHSVFPGNCIAECDIDADFDVDLADFAAFQNAFGG